MVQDRKRKLQDLQIGLKRQKLNVKVLANKENQVVQSEVKVVEFKGKAMTRAEIRGKISESKGRVASWQRELEKWQVELAKSEVEERGKGNYDKVVEELRVEKERRRRAEEEVQQLKSQLEVFKGKMFKDMFGKLMHQ